MWVLRIVTGMECEPSEGRLLVFFLLLLLLLRLTAYAGRCSEQAVRNRGSSSSIPCVASEVDKYTLHEAMLGIRAGMGSRQLLPLKYLPSLYIWAHLRDSLDKRMRQK